MPGLEKVNTRPCLSLPAMRPLTNLRLAVSGGRNAPEHEKSYLNRAGLHHAIVDDNLLWRPPALARRPRRACVGTRHMGVSGKLLTPALCVRVRLQRGPGPP